MSPASTQLRYLKCFRMASADRSPTLQHFQFNSINIRRLLNTVAYNAVGGVSEASESMSANFTAF